MTWDGAAYARGKRAEAKAKGLCANCRHRPAMVQRTQCETCQMASLVKEAFKYDRTRSRQGSTQARGSCYVSQFSPEVRKAWVERVIAKWTGRCSYSGLSIEMGSTASLDHQLPVSRAAAFGPSKVYHPDNLVWCHKDINVLKGDRTADEFVWWLKHELVPSVTGVVS
jgi:5-methylcytosine-specific restriction endonuclease McrA